MTDQNVVRLALAFGRVLRKVLGEETVARINARNATPEYTSACASHDYCDANVLMAIAFRATQGRGPNVGSDADTALWNAAWDEARAGGFACE